MAAQQVLKILICKLDAIKEDELVNVGDVELGLPKSTVEDLTTETEVKTSKS